MQEEFSGDYILGMPAYRSMHNLSSSLSVSKNIAIKIHSAITWSVVLTLERAAWVSRIKKTHIHTRAEGVSE
jgi:hypothetical protein